MGVNAQKRKKKQGPVPTLEESLPKKFKADASSKPKKPENRVKSNGTEKSSKRKVVQERGKETVVDEPQDFGATKASLFDDEEEEEPINDLGAVDDDPMYLIRPDSSDVQGR